MVLRLYSKGNLSQTGHVARRVVAIFGVVVLAACSKVELDPGTSGVLPDGTLFSVAVSTQSYSHARASTKTSVGTCSVPSSVQKWETVVCDVDVPEAQLYHSTLFLEFSAAAEECYYMVFSPYFYLASTDEEFTPRWKKGTTVDCSALIEGTEWPKEKDCYNGAGKDFLLKENINFPQLMGIYYVLDNKAVSKSFSFGPLHDTTNTNRYYSNNLPLSLQDDHIPFGSEQLYWKNDGYVGGTMNNWRFSCYDEWDELKYGLMIVIHDVDDEYDTIYDWIEGSD